MYINEDVLKYFLNDDFKCLEKDKEAVKNRVDTVKDVFSIIKTNEIDYNKIIQIVENYEKKR